MDIFLILSPLILFVIVIAIVFFCIGKFSLKEAITETYIPTKTIYNKEYTTKNIETLLNIHPANTGLATSISKIYPPTVQATSDSSKISISRLIALITSILTIIFVLLVCCLFIYCFLKSKPFPDLSGLLAIFASLGIGIIPYSFNKVSTAISSKKSGTNLTNLQ